MVLHQFFSVNCDRTEILCDSPYFYINTSLQNSPIFGGHERRGLYSNERSGASVETARLAFFTSEDHAYSASRLSNGEEKRLLYSLY